MTKEIVQALEDAKGQDIKVYDVRGTSGLTDYFVVATGAAAPADADLIAKLVLSENEYLSVTNAVNAALKSGDAPAAAAWISSQDKLTKTILTLSAALGLTPEARHRRALPARR